MSIFYVPVAKTDAALLDALVADGVREGRQLDYKQDLWARDDDGKKEFLFDVTSFANAVGGDILVGIEEERDDDGKTTGEPKAVVGIEGNLHEEQLRLSALLESHARPRLVGVVMKTIERPGTRPCLLIRVPRSYVGLHTVVFKDWMRAYSRNDLGKQPLDVEQVYRMVLQGEERRDRLRRWRAARVGQIVAQEGPVMLGAGPKLIFHAIPVAESALGQTLLASEDEAFVFKLKPFDWSVHSWHRNLDGMVVYAEEREAGVSYVQLFRNGGLEAVGADTLRALPGATGMGAVLGSGTGPGIAGFHVERETVSLVGRLQELWRQYGESGPIVFGLTLTGVKGLRLFPHPELRPQAWSFDRDVVRVPEVLAEHLEKPADEILQPVLDMMWNAGGWRRSPHYFAARWRDRG